jgi:plasmid replication initiation protein
MKARHSVDSQFDLFIPAIVDLKWRDQKDTMERPFFSLSKNKRMKPIEYKSARDGIFVTVRPHPEYGMATIWDADILIWAASVVCDLRNRGVNDIPRKLNFLPYDLLKAIERGTSGAQYKRLRESLERLRSTDIRTNIRAPRGKKDAHFGWISEWTDEVDRETGESRGMSLTLSDWFYDGIIQEGGVLSIDRDYFAISGGRERWLYRVARKHAGGNGSEGFVISVPTLYEKSGAEGTYRRFKFEISKVARANELPRFSLSLEQGEGNEPMLRMTRRELVDPSRPGAPAFKKTASSARKKKRPADDSPQLSFPASSLPNGMLVKIRQDFPGWDLRELQALFDEWIRGTPERQPTNYASAFYGFVKRHHGKHKHTLR